MKHLNIQTKRLIITSTVQVVKILFKGTGFDQKRGKKKKKKWLSPTGLIFSFKWRFSAFLWTQFARGHSKEGMQPLALWISALYTSFWRLADESWKHHAWNRSVGLQRKAKPNQPNQSPGIYSRCKKSLYWRPCSGQMNWVCCSRHSLSTWASPQDLSCCWKQRLLRQAI